MSKMLVISAHPDDLEIGMGGTVAKMSENGDAVTSIILTDGRRCPNPFSLTEERIVALRRMEARKAAEVLGISELIFCDLPDLGSETNRSQAVAQLEAVLSRLKPDQVYTLHPQLDRHPTHRSCGQLTLECLQRTLFSSPQIWAYEVWGLFASWDRLEDISSQIGKKMLAIRMHGSQIAAIPYEEGVAGLNRWRAVFTDPQQQGVPSVFAEAFLRLTV